MIQRSGRWTFPQIFVGEMHVGGCDDLHALEQRGGLDPLLARRLMRKLRAAAVQLRSGH